MQEVTVLLEQDELLVKEKCLKELLLTAKTVASEKQQGHSLAKVRQPTLEGWPSLCGDNNL